VQTECNDGQLEFQGLGRRRVVATADGGRITSDAGSLVLREVAERTGILDRLAECFTDYRNPKLIEHSVAELLAQRIYGLANGYEDLNDHDELRRDALLATLVGKDDVTGTSRKRKQDRGCALAGKSTLNRLELTPADATAQSRYQKIVYDGNRIDHLLVDVFLDAHREPPERIVLDLDATDDPLHGEQEGRFFHGYYGCYCYLPLYIFCGDFLLCARLRPSDIDASKGSTEELERIVGQIRCRWANVEIVIRADSGFAREEIMAWCEANGVDYVLGLAKNKRLKERIRKAMNRACWRQHESGQAARSYVDFRYRTRTSWSRKRRVIGKAEYLAKGANPRFIVTSLSKKDSDGQTLYEKVYCARGDMENRIKEQQLGMFADRTSTHTMRANQLRLWLASMAYVLVAELRRVGLRATELAKAQVGTIRTRLFKIGAVVTVSVRRIHVRLSSSHPSCRLLPTILANISRAYPMRA
jgi:Transposase DDE domain group 1